MDPPTSFKILNPSTSFKISILPSQELGLNLTVQRWVVWLLGCKEGWATSDRVVIIDVALGVVILNKLTVWARSASGMEHLPRMHSALGAVSTDKRLQPCPHPVINEGMAVG